MTAFIIIWLLGFISVGAVALGIDSTAPKSNRTNTLMWIVFLVIWPAAALIFLFALGTLLGEETDTQWARARAARQEEA